MPPQPQKGTGKKGRDRDVRQSRSRNTTPSLTGSSLPPTSSGTTPFLDLPINSFRTLEDIIEQYGGSIPSYKDLESLLTQLNVLSEVVDTRAKVCDKGMRMMSDIRKGRMEELEDSRRDKEHKERQARVAADEEERGRQKASKMKKRKDNSMAREERPLTHGAHGIAPQDGSTFDISTPTRDKKPTRRESRERDNDSASSSLSPVLGTTPTATGIDIEDKDDDDSSMDEHQPPPAPAVPHLQTFGEDPSTFPDPTIYEIRPVHDGMSDDMKKEIYSVAVFPKNNLEDKIPGPTPDMDFSNAKPSNQVQFNTFSTYIDPYFRPFTEEDLAFLRERGDRVNPFIIPRRGKRHYTEVWAEEDGAMALDNPQQGRDKLPLNQPRGSIEQMDDNIGETDQISAGPVLSRLLATLRPEHRAPASEEKLTANGITNSEASINGETNGDLGELSQPVSDAPAPLPPATAMPDSNSEAWKKATHPKLDYAQVDERIKQELRHIGFLPPDTEPDYDAHYDDETAQRLRVLQEMLKARAIKNGAMKARLMDLTKEQMAYQEFNTILEDLDDQVKTAYLKRTRTLGKSKKAKRPGGAGGGSHFVGGGAGNTGMARPGIGDVTKTVMEKRRKWIETVGPVLDPDASKVRRSADPDSSIFKDDDLAHYMRREQEMWDEALEDE